MSNFVRQYSDAMSEDICDTLVAWFDTVDEVKTVKADRLTRKDEQKWLTFEQHSALYTRVQKCKYDMLHRYLEEYSFCYRGIRKLISPDTNVHRNAPVGCGFTTRPSAIS